MREPGYWNGEPCEIEVIRIKMIDSPDVPLLFWGKPFYGEPRQAIRVFYGKEPFVIDNEDGMGYRKVTKGMGSPSYGHRSIFAFEEMYPEAPIDVIKWNSEKYKFIELKIEAYFIEHHPKEWNNLKSLKNSISDIR